MYKVGQKAGAAKRSSAYTKTAHHFRFISDTDLAKLNTCTEDGCQIFNQIAEIHAAVCGEIKQELLVVKRVLYVNKLHVKLVLGDFFFTDHTRTRFSFTVLLVAFDIVFDKRILFGIRPCVRQDFT